MANKKTVRKGNFLKRVQNSPKMKSIKAKMRKVMLAKKKLSTRYKRLVKSESRRLSRQ